MFGEHERRLRPALRLVRGVGDGIAADEVRPPVPRSLLDVEEQVGRLADGSAAAVVSPLIRRHQAAIGQEAQAERVAQPPRDELEIRPVGITPHHRSGAGNFGGNPFPGLRGRPERDERAGRDGRVRPAGQRIRGFDVDAGEHDVEARYIVGVRQSPQPADLVGVQTDDREVAHRALTEIEPAVGPEGHHVGVVVAGARKPGEHSRAPTVEVDALYSSAVALVGDIERPVMPRDPVDGRTEPAHHQLALPVFAQPPYATARRRAAERQPRPAWFLTRREPLTSLSRKRQAFRDHHGC